MIEGNPTGASEETHDAPLPAIVLVNAGWQGNVYAGVDAALDVVRRLATDDSEATARILEQVVVLVNVAPNPDGRVAGSSGNATDLDLAADLVVQTQPETRAVVDLVKAWSPMVALDVDGFGSPMVIQASAPPRSVPSGDLFTAWSLDIAHAISSAVHTASGHAPETVTLGAGGSDWPHLNLAGYASYHGAYGFSLTVASRNGSGVSALDAAISGALAFIADHRAALIRDQTRLLSEGLLRGGPPAGNQTRNASTPLRTGPVAYLIPADGQLQQNRHEAAALVNHLIANGVRVERTRGEPTVQTQTCPPGAYLVRLDQPRGGLAATLLWSPLDAGSAPQERAAAGWSLPVAWGVTCLPLDRLPEVATEAVTEAQPPAGRVPPGSFAAYAYTADHNAAIVATNALVAEDVPVYWAPSAFSACAQAYPAGTFVVLAGPASTHAVTRLTEEYGVDLHGVCAMPPSLTRLRPRRVATLADPSVPLVLSDLGFDVTPISGDRLGAGETLATYETLIISGQKPMWERLSPAGRLALQDFVHDGGHVIAIGAAGVDLAIALGIADIDATVTSPLFAAMAAVTCDPTDPLTTSYAEHTILLAVAPVWFTYLPEGATTAMQLSRAGPVVAGNWPIWDDIHPAGQPVIVHIPRSTGSLTLFGLDPTVGAFDRHAFRLLAQAIYRGAAVSAHGTH